MGVRAAACGSHSLEVVTLLLALKARNAAVPTGTRVLCASATGASQLRIFTWGGCGQVLYPVRVFLMRGNHEDRSVNKQYPRSPRQ